MTYGRNDIDGLAASQIGAAPAGQLRAWVDQSLG